MERYPLLDRINSPADLKQLEVTELPELCGEIRSFLLQILSEVPGHLAANLGVVELTVALHYVFDVPKDKIVWDVGHQAYIHKLLTGRKKDFLTLRQWGGLSGFTHPNESECDAFISGHASNSISAALGLAVANQLQGRDSQVVAVIGDGAMTGGLAFEGLNNVSNCPNNLLIILNDNHISIDPITGGLSKYLVKITSSKGYNNLRQLGYQGLRRLNMINDRRKKGLLRFNNSLKALINDESNLFEGFSIRYLGPMDGHDVCKLVERMEMVRAFDGPKLLHLKTIKGKGYAPAEESVVVWHAPGKFDIHTGERLAQAAPSTDELSAKVDKPLKFQEIFGRTLVELADQDSRIVGITPAMVSGSSFGEMQMKYPDRVFDVGIAEGHAVTFAAGLAMNGMIPFCNIYSSFLQRGYDQVIHDVAMQRAPVILCLDRAGLVGEDGMTHQGLYDIAYLRAIPGLTIMSPINEEELRMMMYTAYKHYREGPFVIRFPRGSGSCPQWHRPFIEIPLGKAQLLKKGEEVVVISYGPIGYQVQKAIQKIEEEAPERYRLAHLNLRFVKPLDEEALRSIAKEYRHIVVVEDAALAGGVGSAILEFYAHEGLHVDLSRLGVEDEFIKQGSVQEQYAYAGIDSKHIVEHLHTLY